jgi:hypothetical protein
MEPGEALSTAAQIAVTLAGFAGVVVVFRRESVPEWSPIDKFRLRLPLTNSILSLTFCMIGLLLLAIKPAPRHLEMVQRRRACDSFAIRHSDNEKFSPLRSAATKKCTRHPVPVLSVRRLRDPATVLQRRDVAAWLVSMRFCR